MGLTSDFHEARPADCGKRLSERLLYPWNLPECQITQVGQNGHWGSRERVAGIVQVADVGVLDNPKASSHSPSTSTPDSLRPFLIKVERQAAIAAHRHPFVTAGEAVRPCRMYQRRFCAPKLMQAVRGLLADPRTLVSEPAKY